MGVVHHVQERASLSVATSIRAPPDKLSPLYTRGFRGASPDPWVVHHVQERASLSVATSIRASPDKLSPLYTRGFRGALPDPWELFITSRFTPGRPEAYSDPAPAGVDRELATIPRWTWPPPWRPSRCSATFVLPRFCWGHYRTPATDLSATPSGFQAGPGSLQDQFPLHFRHSGKDVEEKASSGSFGVDTVSERTKIDLPRIKFGSKVNQPFH